LLQNVSEQVVTSEFIFRNNAVWISSGLPAIFSELLGGLSSYCPENFGKTKTKINYIPRTQNTKNFQYSETNVMHFLFNLLRIKCLYMFRALLAHLQEALHKRHLVYCVRVMSVGCTRTGVELQRSRLTYEYHASSIPSDVCVAPPEDEQVMLETCRDT
jgi:hypothetical protein